MGAGWDPLAPPPASIKEKDMPGIEEQFLRDQAFVAASQTDQVISARAGSIIQRFIITPESVDAGTVTFQEGAAGTDRVLFTGGVGSVAYLRPMVIEYGGRATGDGFRVSTGANVSVIVIGKFN